MSARPGMGRLARFVPLAGALLLLGRLVACSSGDGSAPAGTTAATGSSSSGSPAQTWPFSSDDVSKYDTCVGTHPCLANTPTCQGNAVVAEIVPCDAATFTCTGTPRVAAIPCPEGWACSGGACLSRVSPPAKSCKTAADCGLPPSVCVEADHQMAYTDPSCDDGQCRWKQVLYDCDGFPDPFCDPSFRQCTVGSAPVTAAPVVQEYPTQVPPSTPPTQACATAADCKPPPASCYMSSVVSYVDPACESGSCVWELSLSQCPTACNGGACADAQCEKDADCPAWPPTCQQPDPEVLGLAVESCAMPYCSVGKCRCNPAMIMCQGATPNCDAGTCVP